MRKKFKEIPQFQRDGNTNAILRVSSQEIDEYKSKRTALQRQENEINKLKEEVSSLKQLMMEYLNNRIK
jgi:small-conductance mechanosensitive channel